MIGKDLKPIETCDKENDYVEAEIVDGFDGDLHKPQHPFLYWIRDKFGKMVLFIIFPLSLMFVVAGFIFSITLIGMILGIPLILIGLLLLYLGFRFLAFIYRK